MGSRNGLGYWIEGRSSHLGQDGVNGRRFPDTLEMTWYLKLMNYLLLDSPTSYYQIKGNLNQGKQNMSHRRKPLEFSTAFHCSGPNSETQAAQTAV